MKFLVIFFVLSAASRAFSQLYCYIGSNSSNIDNELQQKPCADHYIHQINTTRKDYLGVNITYSLNNPEMKNVSSEDIKFCVLFKHHDSGNLDFACDIHYVCSEEGLQKQFCHDGNWGSLYCCAGNFCNSVEKVEKSLDTNRVCYSSSDGKTSANVPCDLGRCVNSTVYDTNGKIMQTTFGCFNESVCQSDGMAFDGVNNCTDRTSANHQRQRNCTCSTDMCNYFPSESVVNPEFTDPSLSRQQSTLVGSVIGALVLVLLGVVLTGIGIKKCYDHRRNKRLEYSYAQLTADMADELDSDDDRLIVP